MKFPIEFDLGEKKMKKTKKTLMKYSDPIGLDVFQAGIAGKKLKKVC